MTRSVLVLVVAAVGGAGIGVLWTFGIGWLSDRPIPRRPAEIACNVGLYRGPVASIAVAAIVAAWLG